MTTYLICRKCGCRMVGELWHGPHCQCPRPDFAPADSASQTPFALQIRRYNDWPRKEAK